MSLRSPEIHTTFHIVPGPLSGLLGLSDEMMVKGALGRERYAGRALSWAARALMLDAAVPARLGPDVKYGLGVITRPATSVGLTWGHGGFFPGYQPELL